VLNGSFIDAAVLYREVCALGGWPGARPQPPWKSIFNKMRNSAGNGGKPTAASNALRVFYEAHLSPYQEAHPADVQTPLCLLCGMAQPAELDTAPRKWQDVWHACVVCDGLLVRQRRQHAAIGGKPS
jgi:hypothetical protein